MPRHEMDWSPYDEPLPAAEVLFAADIGEEVARLEKIITGADEGALGWGRELSALRHHGPAEDYYVKAMALFDVLARRGVLEGFLEPTEANRATYQETNEGWKMLLRQPDGKRGAFEIVYKTAGSRQTVRYLPRGT